MNRRIDYRQLSLWWRSRTPQERAAGFSPTKYRMYPTICISVPTPFCGLVEVFLSSPAGSHTHTVRVSKRALEKLRLFYRSANSKGWYVKPRKDCIQFWRDGRVVNLEATCSAERFLWT